jgi:ribosomal protein L1
LTDLRISVKLFTVDTETPQHTTVSETMIGIKRINTSVNLPRDLYKTLRIAAIRRNMKASEAIEAAIRMWLKSPDQKEAA